MSASVENSPLAIGNVRRFIAFRIFFNARFYYPVFTILFIDFGLTLEHFALLNALWAVTIVLLEVPSGALADTFGRKNLLVFSGVLMVVEIGLLCFVPLDKMQWVFAAFLVNRVLSGTAEAAASGADEAIAYDTLKARGAERQWGRVLEIQMRYQAAARIGAMALGAAVYDPDLLQIAADALGVPVTFTQQMTMRYPLYLTFILALLTLYSALGMKEEQDESAISRANRGQRRQMLKESMLLTVAAGRWILRTPFALTIISAGLLFDHVARMVGTLNSQYYRTIELPEASFGLIGAAMGILGLFIPRVALMLSQKRSPAGNFWLLFILAGFGLLGVTRFWPVVGVIPMMVLSASSSIMAFFGSHYLNQITPSHQRATVLSFKGLSFNLAYGAVGLFYSLLLSLLRDQTRGSQPELAPLALEESVFRASLGYFPWYFMVMVVVFIGLARYWLRHTRIHRRVPGDRD